MSVSESGEPPRVRWALLGSALAAASLACVGLVLLRGWYARSPAFGWMVWNLCLAWVPLGFALGARWAGRFAAAPAGGSPSGRRAARAAAAACGVGWLVFFPNAPYLFTDLVHLRAAPPVPLFYDVVLLMFFAWTGLMLGYVSLFLVQDLVRRVAGRAASWSFAVLVLALSSFGIYLGRVARWNSWDLVVQPAELSRDLERLWEPPQRAGVLTFSLGVFCFLLLFYLALLGLTQLRVAVAQVESADRTGLKPQAWRGRPGNGGCPGDDGHRSPPGVAGR